MEKIKLYLLSIPEAYRAALYSGPFFVLWIIGYSIETDSRTQKAAGRGLVLFLALLSFRAILLIATEIIKGFATLNYPLEMVFFVLKCLGGFAYLLCTGYLAFTEIRSLKRDFQLIDSLALRVERRLQN